MDRDEARAYSVKHLFPMQLLSLRSCAVECFFYSRSFAACPTKPELCEILGSTFGEVGSIRGCYCLCLIPIH